jgi:cation:H+ antiporter
MIYFSLLAGLVLLFAGGEALVRGSVAVAKRLGLSPLLIGLTLVGFGTSMPELVASLEAALRGSPAIAVANAMGSNIANILLILGVAALISPVPIAKQGFRRDAVVLAAVTALMPGLAVMGIVGRATGVGLIAALAGYTGYAYFSEKRGHPAAAATHEESVKEVMPPAMGIPGGLAFTVSGIGAVVLGAHLLIGAAITLARQAQVPEAVIGVTLVAIGTSLPELVTAVMASVRGHGDVAYGNIVGSNVFNILGIVGVAAIVRPTPIPPELRGLDMWVMAGSVALLIAYGATAGRLDRRAGAVLLSGYALYLFFVLHG